MCKTTFERNIQQNSPLSSQDITCQFICLVRYESIHYIHHIYHYRNKLSYTSSDLNFICPRSHLCIPHIYPVSKYINIPFITMIWLDERYHQQYCNNKTTILRRLYNPVGQRRLTYLSSDKCLARTGMWLQIVGKYLGTTNVNQSFAGCTMR